MPAVSGESPGTHHGRHRAEDRDRPVQADRADRTDIADIADIAVGAGIADGADGAGIGPPIAPRSTTAPTSP